MAILFLHTLAVASDAAPLLAFTQPLPHRQPTWERGAGKPIGLQRAQQQHQDGNLEEAVATLTTLLKEDGNHIEAYALMFKVLVDLKKNELADKAMAKARRMAHDLAAKSTLT